MRRAADAALAVGLALISVVLAGPAGDNQPQAHTPGGFAYTLTVVACLALVVRQAWPAVTLAVSTVAVSTYLVLNYPYGPVLLAVAVAVYTLVTRWPLQRAAIAGLLAVLVLSAHVFTWDESFVVSLFVLLPASAWIAVPFALGTVVRLNRQATVRERATEARRVADDERLRVAQEVHDVVGHGLAAIRMQADIALHLLPTKPEQAEIALTAISATSQEALDELRTTLAVVRANDDFDAEERVPTAGLHRLDALTDRVKAAGTPVTTVVTGTRRDLPPAVDLAAYRVVQEALTNVLRHAGPATAAVTVTYQRDALRVRVSDTGHAEPAPEGHGLSGMRERVTTLGGTLDISDGYTITAVFPT